MIRSPGRTGQARLHAEKHQSRDPRDLRKQNRQHGSFAQHILGAGKRAQKYNGSAPLAMSGEISPGPANAVSTKASVPCTLMNTKKNRLSILPI